MFDIFVYTYVHLYDLSLNGWHAVFCITNNRHDVTITTHAIKRHCLIWMTTVRQPTKRRCYCILALKYTFICVYWWTRQRIHNTLIVLDRYLRLIGDKTIPDSAELRLDSFSPPFVAGIDLPHHGVVDSYNLKYRLGDCDIYTSTLWVNEPMIRICRCIFTEDVMVMRIILLKVFQLAVLLLRSYVYHIAIESKNIFVLLLSVPLGVQ